MNCVNFSSSKKSFSNNNNKRSSHKLYSPQPVKMSCYSDVNSSFGSSSPALSYNSNSSFDNNMSIFSNNNSPCKKLFSSPEQQPFYMEEINRLRADSMNQLENEINRYDSKVEEMNIDNNLLLQQLEEDFANFPGNSFSN